MRKFIRRDTVPPGGWRFVVPETKTSLTAGSIDELKRLVKAHLIANSLPVYPDIGAVIEDQLCELVGPAWCEYGTERKYVLNASMSASDVVNGTKVLLSWKLDGSPLVDANEAERRAGICAMCPLNITFGGCVGCSGLGKIVDTLTGGRKTSHDALLKSCAACKCFNRAQVWLPLDTLWRGVTSDINAAFPDHCWKKRL